ncbi:ankyrin repeat domain-containing protein [Brenneria izadpanahii]|uniref:Ankyrin repeat domain-containing protein n=1 Tax=Brenneria izadpanahii TaxID=2722756 RepID=A0ABX7UX44_9GAMM|nr:ankyrin repeat domain-containing protein [Brenneria izadpanahii]QTF08164.1 ankyrin repeat domain-containing protein [Brenneria izadpanahii]
MKLVLSFVVAILFSSAVFAADSNLSDLIWSKKENSEAIQIMNNNPKLINSKNRLGYTPLHLASMVGNKEIVIFLLEKGADVNATDGEGYSPLVRAKANHHQDIVEILIKNGGKELEPQI